MTKAKMKLIEDQNYVFRRGLSSPLKPCLKGDQFHFNSRLKTLVGCKIIHNPLNLATLKIYQRIS